MHRHFPSAAKMFKKMDKNADGGIDASELERMAKRSGQSPEDLLAKIDSDKNGKINAKELADLLEGQQGGENCQLPTSDGPGSSTSIMMVMMQVRTVQWSSQDSDMGGGMEEFMQQASMSFGGMQGEDAFGETSPLADFLKNWKAEDAFGGSQQNAKAATTASPSAFQQGMKEMTTAMLNVMNQLQIA